jgi:hypothetical protein
MKHRISRILCLVFLLSGWVSAQAVTLDWGNENWSGGSFDQSFNFDTGNGGNDVRVRIEGDTGGLVSNVDDTSDLTGGFGATDGESIYLNTDYAQQGFSSTGEIIVRINFNYSQDISNLNFYLFDVDRSNGDWVDLISNFQAYRGGVLQTGVFPTLTAGTANTVENAGGTTVQVRGNASAGDTTDDGNVFVDFGSAIVDEIRFTWTNEDAGLDNQWIGLHNINYTPAPEPATVVTGTLLLALVGLHMLRKKRNFRLSEAA